MAYSRQRNDSSPTVYRVENRLLGMPGEFLLNEKQMRKLALMIRQADRLFCVNILSFEVNPSGYSFVCAASPDEPTVEEMKLHFLDRYGSRRIMPDFADTEIGAQWAKRLRDFSCLVKYIQQRFTQWYNQKINGGLRKGTVWQGRFKSQIIKTVRRTILKLKEMLGKVSSRKGTRRVKGTHWRRRNGRSSFISDRILPIVVSGGGTAVDLARLFFFEYSRFPGSHPLLQLLGMMTDPDKSPRRKT